MISAKVLIMLTILVYLGGMIIIGIYCSKKNENVGDFYLGGRKLGPFVTAMSAEASDMSSYLLMGLPGLAYLSGVADVGWTAIGLAIGTYLNWLVVAKKIRIYTHRLDAITIPDFFSRRYHDEKNILMCIAAVVNIIFSSPIQQAASLQRQAIQHPVRCELYSCHGHQCDCYCAVYRDGRLPCSKHHRPDSGDCDEYCATDYRILRDSYCRRL